MKLKQNEKGVSLVELILSIAVLSLLSVGVIQLFMTSQSLNLKAEELDASVLMSENIFEIIEIDKSLERLMNLQIFKFAEIDTSDEVIRIILYFNDVWEPVQLGDENIYMLTLETQETQALEYSVVEYKIVIQKDENSVLEQLYEIEMQKYY